MSKQAQSRIEPDLDRGKKTIERLTTEYAHVETPLLTPHHRVYARQRSVATLIARVRGYVSCGVGTQYTHDLPAGADGGFSPEQRAHILGLAELPPDAPKTPGRPSKAALAAAEKRKQNKTSLLIPMYSIDSDEPVIYQARPDFPREAADGGTIKFEQPAGVERGSELGDIPVDVHPIARDLVRDGVAPILLTEGVLKADAALSASVREGFDLGTTSVPGVTMPYHAPASAYNPDSPNHGTDPILTDAMLDIPWEDRDVYLCWDADMKFNPGVYTPLLITARLLEEEGARVHVVVVPVTNHDSKAGVDDYLAAADTKSGKTPLADLLNAAVSIEEAEFLTRRYTLDEVGRSDRLAEHAHRYSHGMYSVVHKAWLSYNPANGIWEVDKTGNAIQEVAKRLTEYDLYGMETRDTRTGSGVRNVVDLAQSHPLLKCAYEDMNVDMTYFLNCLDGLIDLRTGELLPHAPERVITRVAPSGYDPTAIARAEAAGSWDEVAPLFSAAIKGIIPDDPDTLRTIQMNLGAALLGRVAGGPGMTFWDGVGSNGKSTFTTALNNILGLDDITGYATILDHEAITQGTTPEIRATLGGKRVLVLQEFPKGVTLNDGDLKRLTSTDAITARFLYGNQFQFVPTHNTIAATNNLPRVLAPDFGTWRRLNRVFFPRKFEKHEMDLKLDDKLSGKEDGYSGEYPQILAWFVQGCLDFLASGTDKMFWSAASVDAIERWRTDYDPFSKLIRFFEVVPDGEKASGTVVTETVLFDLYKTIVGADSGFRRRDEFIKTLHAHQDFPAAAQSVNHARRLIYKNLRLTATGEEQLASTTY